MKKIMAVMLAMMMVFVLAACGEEAAPAQNNGGNSGTASGQEAKKADEFGAEKYGLDLASTELQPMSEECATSEVLKETAKDWLGGNTLFTYSPDADKKSYDEIVEHIGCEPSQYQYDAKNNLRIFIWNAEDDDKANFRALFEEKDGAWKLHSVGTSNLKMA